MKRDPTSLWMAQTKSRRRYPALDRDDLVVDVAIVGGGITGITTALLCKRAGLQVALIETHEVAVGESGHTTSHITELLDTRYHKLLRSFGRNKARRIADSQRSSIERIATFVDQLRIDCFFERVPAYLYTEHVRDIRDLMKELDATRQLGMASSYLDFVPLPFLTRGALRIESQAQFEPRLYLLALCEQIPGNGSHVFEHTQVLKVDDGAPATVETNRGTVRAKHVVIATNSVINGIVLHTKVAAYRSYAIAARVENLPPPGLYWDTDDPYHYTRTQRMQDGNTYLIVGGCDHKVGKETDTEQAFAELEEYVQGRYDVSSFDYRWSGQILEPVDGLPYIGRHTSMHNVYVGTGYSGNGITSGTVAGMLLSDLILGIENPWEDVYNPRRIKPLASAKEFVLENVDYPLHFVGDRVTPTKAEVERIAPGEGGLVNVNGRKLAVYRDAAGETHALSPVCTHMGCHVHWNSAEKSWDCPCHGGRYDARGRVLNGPPTRDLKAVPLPETKPQQEENADERPGTSEEAAP